jgi:galactokinase
MTGGGFGGSVVGLIEQGQAGAVMGAIERRTDRAGLAPPSGRVVWPSAGARRVARTSAG